MRYEVPDYLVPEVGAVGRDLEVDLGDLGYKVRINGHRFGFQVLRPDGQAMYESITKVVCLRV